ncbi:O-antigen ligase family protein [Thalassospira sp. TSL5-1]|uniref:O-antigen ligase family protein n=1 Tax=Thalassospira sp. TSL5-1 TaxID=1544451 RepID=UPI00093DB49D|nr:O-antigen ligase family protein [Thalassospira sp. TSL5-1]
MVRYAKIAAVLFALLVLIFFVNVRESLSYLYGTRISWVFLSLALILLNQILSSFRFEIFLRIFGQRIGFQRSHAVNIYSLLAGMAFFNFFGQSVSRTLLVKDISDADSAVIVTALERIFSLAVLLIASLSAAFLVVGKISFDYAPGVMLSSMGVFVLFSLFSVYFFQLSVRQRAELNLIFSSGFGRKFFSIIFVILIMHSLMLGAYLALIVGMAGVDVFSAKAVFATLLTMLGASFPISFGGWGIREVSAGFAFSAANISPALGVGAGIGVGLLSLIALALNVCGVWVIKRFFPDQDLQLAKVRSRTGYSRRLILLLGWVVAPIVVVFMMVQLPIPIASGKVTVNLADPLAIVAGMTFIFVIIQRRAWRDIWRNHYVNWWLLGSAAIVLLSFLIGYAQFGFQSWAFYNRLIGIGILFSYIVVGAFLTALWGGFGARAVAKAVVSSAILIFVFEYILRMTLGWDVLIALNWASSRWSGFLANPNSYAFFLLSVLPLPFLFLGSRHWTGLKAWGDAAVPGLIFALLYLTGSRAAFGSVAVFLIVFFMFDARKTIRTIVCGGFYLILIFTLNEAIIFFVNMGAGTLQIIARPDDFSTVQSDRILSMVEGWKMFISHPLLGAGLGAFYKSQVELNLPLSERALIIHNSFLWVLAEMGIAGFAVIFVPPITWCVRTFSGMQWRKDPYQCGLLLIMANAAIMGMAHELVYQRVFWFMLGIFLARPFIMRKQVNRLSHS